MFPELKSYKNKFIYSQNLLFNAEFLFFNCSENVRIRWKTC